MDTDRPNPLMAALRWGRRHLALLVALLAVAWVITLFLWIAFDPVAGTGNPMD